MDTSSKVKHPLFGTLIAMMVSPAKALKESVNKIPWFFSLAVSSLAFGLFFFQTGFDLFKTGQRGLSYVFLSTATGLIYGLAAIPLLAVILWLVLKIAKTDKSLTWTISSICLSYSGTLIYGLLGIVFSFTFGWKTAVAFGITGVLWATGPIIATIREMTKGKTLLGIVMATLAGAAVLFSWATFVRL